MACRGLPVRDGGAKGHRGYAGAEGYRGCEGLRQMAAGRTVGVAQAEHAVLGWRQLGAGYRSRCVTKIV